MSVHRLAEMTWEEVDKLDRAKTVAVLPVGAVEAHGPHLPLITDVIISDAMARSGAEKLTAKGMEVLILPSVAYSAAGYAVNFAGTIPLSRETAAAALGDIGAALVRHGFPTLAIANSHLDPTHLASLYDAVQKLNKGGKLKVIFPDITTKPWARRLTKEFKSGACHAGQFEGSVVMAERPDLVREDIRKSLPPNPSSLSEAIRTGKNTFEEAGGSRAYFGSPADASAEEGRRTIDILGSILEEAVLESA